MDFHCEEIWISWNLVIYSTNTNSTTYVQIAKNTIIWNPLYSFNPGAKTEKKIGKRARHNNKPALKQRGSQLAPSTFLSIFSHNLDIEMENQTCLPMMRQEDYFWREKMALDPVLQKMVYLQIFFQ